MKPKISVILTSYNQLTYIRKQIEVWKYVYENQFKDFELIVCDDGSNDFTREYLRSIKLPFKMKIYEQIHDGMRLAKCKNEGIKLASGEYILILDGDTFPGRNTLIPMLESLSPDMCLMGRRFRVDFQKLNRRQFDFDWLDECVTREDFREVIGNIPKFPIRTFSGANVLFPAKHLKEIGWAPDDWRGFGYDDYWCALQWLAKGLRIRYIEKSVAFHVEHSNTDGDLNLRERIAIEKQRLQPIIEEKHKGWFKF